LRVSGVLSQEGGRMSSGGVGPGARLRRTIARVVLAPIVPAMAALPVFVRVMPESWSVRLGRLFARLSRSGRRRDILARRRAVLGCAGDEDAFWSAHLDHVGRTIIESFALDVMSDAEIVERIDITGEDHLRAVLDRGHGAILFLNHLGSPGAIVGGLGLRGYDLTIAGNRMEAMVLGERVTLHYAEAEVQRLFRRGRVHRALLGDNLPRSAAEVLDRNGCFAMFIDFPVVRKHNQQVAFGSAYMNVNLGPALLALRHEASVLCVDCLRTGENRHRLVIHPPLGRASGDRRDAALQMMEASLQSLVRSLGAHPDQWWPWDWADITAGVDA